MQRKLSLNPCHPSGLSNQILLALYCILLFDRLILLLPGKIYPPSVLALHSKGFHQLNSHMLSKLQFLPGRNYPATFPLWARDKKGSLVDLSFLQLKLFYTLEESEEVLRVIVDLYIPLELNSKYSVGLSFSGVVHLNNRIRHL